MKSLVLIAIALSSFSSWARSYRGAYQTNVKCNISSYREARACMVRLANYIPTGNDSNAVLVTRSKKSKVLMKEILVGMNEEKDFFYVDQADYLAVAVQNDDEESIYYYALSNGINVTPKLLGYSLSAVDDLGEAMCESYFLSPKFMNPWNLFLGMDHNNSLNGTIWFADDMECY